MTDGAHDTGLTHFTGLRAHRDARLDKEKTRVRRIFAGAFARSDEEQARKKEVIAQNDASIALKTPGSPSCNNRRQTASRIAPGSEEDGRFVGLGRFRNAQGSPFQSPH